MASSERSTRPPSMGNAGTRLNSSMTRLPNRRNSGSPCSARANACSGVTPLTSRNVASAVARITFTPGPASATTSSWVGFSGMRSSCATPPNGSSTILRVAMP